MISAALSNVANFTMDIVFIFVFGWGVAGAALATSASQYVGMAAMLYLLKRRRILNFAHLRHVPSISEIAPLLSVSWHSMHLCSPWILCLSSARRTVNFWKASIDSSLQSLLRIVSISPMAVATPDGRGQSSSLQAMMRTKDESDGAFCLQSGLALSVRNLGTMGVILYGTTLVSRMGAATLAAHEIMRQVFIFSIQLFSALDVTAQSMVGLQLGKVSLQGPITVTMRVSDVLLVT